MALLDIVDRHHERLKLTLLPSPLIVSIFLLTFVGYFFIANPIFLNPDVSWHLAAGDLILDHRSIPKHDSWSYLSAGAPWYNIEWAWDVAISLIMRLWGAVGLYLFTCLLGSFNVALLASQLKRRGQLADSFIVMMAALAALAQLAVLYPQPNIVTICFALLLHNLLHVFSRRVFIVIPLLMCLWGNMHGGFLIGFILMGAYMIEAYEQHDFARLKQYCTLVALSLAAIMINPFHVHIITGVLRTLDSAITPYLADWHPVTFGTELVITLPLVFFILCSNVREPNIRLADKIIAFGWLLAGLQARRNFVIFVMLSAPYFAYCLQELARAAQRQRFQANPLHFPDTIRTSCHFLLLAFFICGLLIFSPLRNALLNQERYQLNPYGIKDAFQVLSTRFPHTRFINDYNLGGYLLYHSAGAWPVFADGRAGSAYSESALKEAIAFNTGSEDALALFKKYDIKGVIVMRRHPILSRLDHKDWEIAFSNNDLVAYIRK